MSRLGPGYSEGLGDDGVERLEGDGGDCGDGSENIFAPGEGRDNHPGVWPMTLDISSKIEGDQLSAHGKSVHPTL